MKDSIPPTAKLEALRKKIVEANPECGQPDVYADNYGKECSHARLIRLTDVLLTLRHEFATRAEQLGDEKKQNRKQWTKVDRIGFAFAHLHDSFHCGKRAWNLRKDSLDDQAEETIDFLHSLICS